jgi:allantoate deiminase
VTAAEVIACCRRLALCSEESGATTRTFLSKPMREVHSQLTATMRHVGMEVRVDAAGNLRAVYGGTRADAARWLIGSHLDSVRHAGAFDGVLGVVLGIAIVSRLRGRRLPVAIEVVGFSEEEGVRFGVPFIGSRAMTGTVDAALLDRVDAGGVRVRDAIAAYGLDQNELPKAVADRDTLGYFEMHIEQGPVLDEMNAPLGVVCAIAGQTRLAVSFMGAANHAGTTPMARRRDALAGAAEWITRVERGAAVVAGLVATVGRIEVSPGAANVIPGTCMATLDVRHADDRIRESAVATFIDAGREIAAHRNLEVDFGLRLNQPAVPMDAHLTARLEAAVTSVGYPVHTLPSGAGHDAMVLAERMPVAMLFLRTPGGVSHHPDETVREEDVEAALRVGIAFLENVARDSGD